MFATDINDNTPASHSVDRGDPLDRRLAEQRLADGATPWEVMGQHLANEGAFTLDALSWLVENGDFHHDIGRFARRCGVPDDTIRKMQDSLSAKDGDSLRVGYIIENPPRPLPEKLPFFKVWPRAELPAGDPHTASLAAQTWTIVKDTNEPARTFRVSATVCRSSRPIGSDAIIKPLTEKHFIHVQHREIEWYKVNQRTGDRYEVEPPDRVIKDMLAHPHPPLPDLVGVRPAPVFGPDGELASEWGYDASSKMFVWPYGLDVPFVPEHPTKWDIAKARASHRRWTCLATSLSMTKPAWLTQSAHCCNPSFGP